MIIEIDEINLFQGRGQDYLIKFLGSLDKD